MQPLVEYSSSMWEPHTHTQILSTNRKAVTNPLSDCQGWCRKFSWAIISLKCSAQMNNFKSKKGNENELLIFINNIAKGNIYSQTFRWWQRALPQHQNTWRSDPPPSGSLHSVWLGQNLGYEFQCDKVRPPYHLQQATACHLCVYYMTLPIPQKSSTKYLGVTISSDLSWTKHIEAIRAKALRTLGLIRRKVMSQSKKERTRALYDHSLNMHLCGTHRP